MGQILIDFHACVGTVLVALEGKCDGFIPLVLFRFFIVWVLIFDAGLIRDMHSGLRKPIDQLRKLKTGRFVRYAVLHLSC